MVPTVRTGLKGLDYLIKEKVRKPSIKLILEILVNIKKKGESWELIIKHYKAIISMYCALYRNLSPRSIIPNWSSFGKTGYYEQGINLLDFTRFYSTELNELLSES